MVLLPITLSSGYSLVVQKGDIVKVGQALAEKENTGDDRISLAEAFSSNPHSVGKYLKVQPGDSVKDGDVIAVRKSLLREDKVFSEVSGTVLGFERDTGELVIRPLGSKASDSKDQILSPIDGTVSVCNNEQIVIQTEKDILIGDRGVGGSEEAELLEVVVNDTVDAPSLLFSLDPKVIGRVILAEKIDRDSLLKAIGMGASGIITSDIHDTDMNYLIQRNISTPVILFNQDTWKKVLKWVGKKVYINGMSKTVLLLHT